MLRTPIHEALIVTYCHNNEILSISKQLNDSQKTSANNEIPNIGEHLDNQKTSTNNEIPSIGKHFDNQKIFINQPIQQQSNLNKQSVIKK